MNTSFATATLDLHDLAVFRLVAQYGSFTRAARAAGLTQSAVSRQIQGLEASLGVVLLERTTRQVRLTPAGTLLAAESGRIAHELDTLVAALQERFSDSIRPLRIGVSSTLGQAYLPGFFHAHLQRCPGVPCRVQSQPSAQLAESLAAGELDLAVLDSPHRLPESVAVVHRFEDPFTLIGPAGRDISVLPWEKATDWLLLSENSATGAQLRSWMRERAGPVVPLMEFDSFDLIIGLVSLGMGISWVPRRALAPYPKGRFRQFRPPQAFHREIVVLTRKQRQLPEPLRRFVANILFS